MGRPSLKTPELVEAICARLAEGEPLAAICRDDGMPNASTVWDWQQSDPAVSQAIARAREQGFDAIAVDALQLIDNIAEDPASRRIRFDGRLKLLAKWDPKRYGDKLGIGQAEGLEATKLAVAINFVNPT
jgi:hypothetical protein